jgi:DnaJ-class molecular chaperone
MKMDDRLLDQPTLKTARGDVLAERICLRCRSKFPSNGFGERICKRCKGSGAWKNGALPLGNGSRGSKAKSSGSGY